MESLTNLGFRRVGLWRLDAGVLRLELDDLRRAQRVLYAFVSSGQLKYIGQSKKTLGGRLAGYLNPQPSQRTNVRVNEKLVHLLSTGAVVDIYGFTDSGLFSYGGFHLNLAAGLEDSLVSALRPEWNLVGNTGAKVQAPAAAPIAPHTPPAQPATSGRSATQASAAPRLADQIREYVYETYIKPALSKGEATVMVRAGDVHDAMRLTARFPAVCGALGTRLFLDHYNLMLVSKEGPAQGANVYFTYALPPGGRTA